MHKTTHHRLIARSRHWLHLERLELRRLLSVNFSDPHTIVQPELDGPELVFAVDLDGDADLDLLAATRYDNRVVCYENMDGAGTFGPQRTISTMGVAARSPIARDAERTAYPADLDGDGDLDVLHAIRGETIEDDKIVWYENVDGTGSFGPPKVITTLARTAVHAADLDGDGDVDVLSFSNEDDKIAWHENRDGAGTFGPERVIATDINNPEVITVDLDGDRDVDVLLSNSRETIVWLENTNGHGNFSRHDITTSANRAQSAIAADVDRDGDLDVLAAEEDGIALYENTDGTGNFAPQRLIIEYEVDLRPWAIRRAADMDHDGDLDLLLAGGEETEIAWYENLTGDGTFGGKRVVTQEALGYLGGFIDAADLDTDGNVDVVFAAEAGDKIAWHPNLDGAGTFGPQQRVGSGVGSPGSTAISDVDGDGDPDVVYQHGDTVVWQENTDGLGTYRPQRLITQVLDFDSRTFGTADLDGDGDADLISGPGISWYENTDGLGTYGPQRVIAQGWGGGVSAADLDGDGDLDLLQQGVASGYWHENVDGAGNSWTRHVIDTRNEAIWGVSAADLDGDGDLDVLGTESDNATWYENTDGLGTYGPKRVITTGRWGVIATNLDGDGDLDVLASTTGTVAWFENEDGAGSFGPGRVIDQYDSRSGPAIAVADLDDDGDLDVILASREESTNIIGFYENTDGAGTFGPQLVIRTYSGFFVRDVFATDVDTDGDLDVVTRSEDGIFWYENLLAHPGDANRDGRFDSTDLVQVFQAGEYEDDVDGNSTWAEGDWNGDGDFDSGDLVEAFQKGLYERKSRVVAAEIAAAVDWLFTEEQSIRRGRAYVA